MRELCSGVWQLDGWPPDIVDVYLVIRDRAAFVDFVSEPAA
jgi:hypothetical protein